MKESLVCDTIGTIATAVVPQLGLGGHERELLSGARIVRVLIKCHIPARFELGDNNIIVE